jgi:hypothetical protein
MAAERDLELLDDYLTNRLNAEERAQFENRLKQDPELQHEYSFHKSIAEGLRSVRKAELKAMLNNIPVPPIEGTPTIVKWAGGVTVALIIGIGIYFFLMPEPHVQEAAKPVTTPPVIEQDETTPEKSRPETIATVPPTESNTPKSAVPAPRVTPKTSEQPAKKIQAYDPSADEQGAGENTNQPESNTGDVTPPAADLMVETVIDKTYSFHYKWKGDLITLYGKFDAPETFTILDFRDEGKAYLFYKNAYYLMTENETVKALSPVNDPVLLNKLRSKRGN